MNEFPATCVQWRGRLDKDGYGFVVADGERRAHRVIFALFHGPIPTRMQVLHSCDNPSCVNPRHLRLGTPKDNGLDKVIRKRAPSGAKHPNAKLSAAQALHIKSGLNRHEAKKLYGIGKSAFYRVRGGLSYREHETI